MSTEISPALTVANRKKKGGGNIFSRNLLFNISFKCEWLSANTKERGKKVIVSLMKEKRLVYYKLLGTKIIWTNHLDGKLAPVVSLPLGCFPVDGIRVSDCMVNMVDLTTLAASR